MKVRWSEQAALRLAEIEQFIARSNAQAAGDMIDALITRALGLEELPRMGRPLPELPESDLRELVEWPYRIVHRVRGAAVQIVTVFDGRRLLPRSEVATP